MSLKLSYIKDVIGNNYIGIYFNIADKYFDKMSSYVGDELDIYIQNQQNRDNGKYHSTVISVMEYNSIVNKHVNYIDEINNIISSVEITDFKMLGLGKSEKNGNIAFYIVCSSEQLQDIRKKLGLGEKDLHITIGFKWKDVHGVPKREILPDIDPFKKELYNFYIAYGESFFFIKEIEGYDYNFNRDIYPVKLTNTYINFRVDGNGLFDYFTVTIINNKFNISCKWQSSEEIAYMSNTMLLRKLKQ